MGVVAHEAREFQMAWMGGDPRQQRIQLPGLGESATVQAHVDFHIDAQAAVQPPGQFQVFLQSGVGVDQPLQLAVRVEAGVLRQFLIEAGGGPHRHRFAEQQVAARLRLGHGVDERLVEHHHPVGAGLRHYLADQRHAGQGFGDDTIGAPGWQCLLEAATVGRQPLPVNKQQRAPRPAVPEQSVVGLEISAVGAALVAGLQPPGGGQAAAQGKQEGAPFHAGRPLASMPNRCLR